MTNQGADGTVLDAFVEPSAYAVAVTKHSRWGLAGAMVAVFFALTAASVCVVLQDEDLVADYTEKVLGKPRDAITQERLEEIREATQAALGMPGMTIILGLVSSASTVLHLLITWLVIACGLTLVINSHVAFARVILVAAASLPILMLGRVVNLVLRLAFRDLTAVAGLLPALGAGGANSVVGSLLASVDVFVIWYLTVFAIGVSASTTVGVGKASMVVFALWATVLLCSFFLGQGAGWTM